MFQAVARFVPVHCHWRFPIPVQAYRDSPDTAAVAAIDRSYKCIYSLLYRVIVKRRDLHPIIGRYATIGLSGVI